MHKDRELGKNALVGLLPPPHLAADVLDLDVREEAALVVREHELGDLRYPHPRQLLPERVLVPLPHAARLEVEDAALVDEAPPRCTASCSVSVLVVGALGEMRVSSSDDRSTEIEAEEASPVVAGAAPFGFLVAGPGFSSM